jgi:DNA-binding CsgD family transcriptional regulator
LAIAEEIDHLAWISAALCTLGSIQMELLELHAARLTLERAHAAAKETGSLHWTRVSAGFLARCYLASGETVLAQAVLDETLDVQTGFRTLGERVISTARIELALSQKKPDEAIKLIGAMITATGNAGLIAPRIGGLRGDALALLGDSSSAETAYVEAANQARSQEQHGLLWRIHASLSRLHRETGQRSRSLEDRRQAQELIDTLAETMPSPDAREAFLNAAAAYLPAPVTQLQATKIAFGGLTERERELAGLLARGLSNAAIARSLVISERTVETHITNILAKLNFSSRSQIAVWAVESGLASGA